MQDALANPPGSRPVTSLSKNLGYPVSSLLIVTERLTIWHSRVSSRPRQCRNSRLQTAGARLGGQAQDDRHFSGPTLNALNNGADDFGFCCELLSRQSCDRTLVPAISVGPRTPSRVAGETRNAVDASLHLAVGPSLLPELPGTLRGGCPHSQFCPSSALLVEVDDFSGYAEVR